jgi:hypothetical protein
MMTVDWNRLATQMIREMVRQFLQDPGELLTFGQLAFRIEGSDKLVLQAIADSRPDLFLVVRDGQFAKLHFDAVRRIVNDGIDAVMIPGNPPILPSSPKEPRTRCSHFDLAELANDLLRFSLPSEALVRNCCWSEICRIRATIQPKISEEDWSHICFTRGYLLSRHNPRGF